MATAGKAAANVRRISSTDHFGRTFFTETLEFIDHSCEIETLFTESTSENMGVRINFGPLIIAHIGFLDESFWVRVPRGRAGTGLWKHRQFHTRFSTVSS